MPKKKSDAGFICTHCQTKFHVELRWCARCEDHCGRGDWILGKDVCDRCYSGENDDYLDRRKGRQERIAALIERAKDQANWCNCGVVERFEKWCASPEYADRFRPIDE